jgi:hypothetical protein
MNKRQERAIESFRNFLQRSLTRYDGTVPYGGEITKFEVKAEPLTYGPGEMVFVSAETELTGLAPGNLLRALDHTWWLIKVGDRGAIDILSGPRHYSGRYGRRVEGFNWKIRPVPKQKQAA